MVVYTYITMLLYYPRTYIKIANLFLAIFPSQTLKKCYLYNPSTITRVINYFHCYIAN